MKRIDYRGKVAIITGASKGIGKELALQLAAQGAKLVLAARDQQRLEQLAEQCRLLGAEALVQVTDVGEKAACQALVEATVAQFGAVDLLFNNAGYAVSTELMALEDISLYEKQMQVNFHGSMYCTYYALPHLVTSKGVVCSVSSIAGYVSMAGSSIYNASKYAMRGFFDALRQELADKGVGVTMIYPGYVVTEFMANVQDGSGKERGERALKFYKPSMMSAQRCAELILKATAKRKRAVVMTFSANLGIWLNRLFPGLIDLFLIRYRRRRNRQVGDE